ncbi:unnamed protein product [Brassica rapa]|uniref:Uncharacterized protein n=1 Tax=Brassica campestris TaxID=3711 RepID=A0A8D9G847_BRACM|nr:unnamed protein product [Brassica rapa]
MCVMTDIHGWPVCADGHPRTSFHGKGKRADSNDQRADMCTDGQPRTSSMDVLSLLTDTHRHTQTASDNLCVLTDTHRHPVCADGHPPTSCVY